KSPIHTIKGMLNIISEDHQSKIEAGVAEILEHISGSADRLEALVASVLEYAKVSGEELKVVPVDLNPVVESVLRDFDHLINQAEGKISVENSLPRIMGNTTQVYQIISNLVSNAIKYRDKKRPLEIKISLLEASNDREVCLAVIDNGQGLAKHQQEKIFRPFQRAHGKEIEGSGIGLACVKKLLEKIGGSIKLESQQGEGSSFIVYFKKASQFS
ncbi:MAG: HAMP domain-containing histidine kinase, partial [Bdellovibrionales bacterium]|nr:HAMP domain-containing histidine kinase [Bdellovibrionales bacterium]